MRGKKDKKKKLLRKKKVIAFFAPAYKCAFTKITESQKKAKKPTDVTVKCLSQSQVLCFGGFFSGRRQKIARIPTPYAYPGALKVWEVPSPLPFNQSGKKKVCQKKKIADKPERDHTGQGKRCKIISELRNLANCFGTLLRNIYLAAITRPPQAQP